MKMLAIGLLIGISLLYAGVIASAFEHLLSRIKE